MAQRFLGHNCLGLRRCVRGQRVMFLHSMEISASLRKLFCWLGKSVQPLPADTMKTSMFGFLNAKFEKHKANKGKPTKTTIVTQRFLGHNCSGVNVSCCCTAWRYQQAWENSFADLGSLCNHCHQIPVVPHKAVAEVSRIGNYRRDWLLWVTGGREKTLMDRTVQLCNWPTD